MKILQVISYFNPRFGGDVNICYNLSKELVKRGHEVTIITTDYGFDTTFAQEAEAQGIKVVPFQTKFNSGLFLYTPAIDIWLEEYVTQFDVIHMHNYRSYQNNRVLKSLRSNNVPFLLQPHGSLVPFAGKIVLKQLYDLVWGDELLKKASKIIVLNSAEVEQCLSRGIPREKIEIIPNGIDPAAFDNLPPFGLFRKNYNIPQDSRLILYIGRLHKSKGLDFLIESFGDLVKSEMNIYLAIAGPDDGYSQLLSRKISELKLQDKAQVIGYISPEEKFQALVDSDIFVTASYSGFPVTFLEACASGIPIVTTKMGDNLDWIENNVGFVVNPQSELMANAIKSILQNNDLKKKFSRNGKKIVKEQFAWSSIVEHVEMQYLSV